MPIKLPAFMKTGKKEEKKLIEQLDKAEGVVRKDLERREESSLELVKLKHEIIVLEFELFDLDLDLDKLEKKLSLSKSEDAALEWDSSETVKKNQHDLDLLKSDIKTKRGKLTKLQSKYERLEKDLKGLDAIKVVEKNRGDILTSLARLYASKLRIENDPKLSKNSHAKREINESIKLNEGKLTKSTQNINRVSFIQFIRDYFAKSSAFKQVKESMKTELKQWRIEAKKEEKINEIRGQQEYKAVFEKNKIKLAASLLRYDKTVKAAHKLLSDLEKDKKRLQTSSRLEQLGLDHPNSVKRVNKAISKAKKNLSEERMKYSNESKAVTQTERNIRSVDGKIEKLTAELNLLDKPPYVDPRKKDLFALEGLYQERIRLNTHLESVTRRLEKPLLEKSVYQVLKDLDSSIETKEKELAKAIPSLKNLSPLEIMRWVKDKLAVGNIKSSVEAVQYIARRDAVIAEPKRTGRDALEYLLNENKGKIAIEMEAVSRCETNLAELEEKKKSVQATLNIDRSKPNNKIDEKEVNILKARRGEIEKEITTVKAELARLKKNRKSSDKYIKEDSKKLGICMTVQSDSAAEITIQNAYVSTFGRTGPNKFFRGSYGSGYAVPTLTHNTVTLTFPNEAKAEEFFRAKAKEGLEFSVKNEKQEKMYTSGDGEFLMHQKDFGREDSGRSTPESGY